jgi:hypothetical protein
MFWLLDFVEERNREVLEGNPAPAVHGGGRLAIAC